jgi:Brp/Blh family beta-carotene 15,15'-monooxygenase
MRHDAALMGTRSLALVLLAAAVLHVDRKFVQAGAWALVGLSLTVGFAHGALDAALLRRRFADRPRWLAWLVAYLFAVIVIGWLLSSAINMALWLLILMSVWHFGEPYGRWNGLPAWSASLTRAVVGGAPIMLPVWLAPLELSQTLAPIVDAFAIQIWRVFASCWLALLVVWMPACGFKTPGVMKFAWAEITGCALAYLLFSPLMAFAVYFGLYHAPVHIWRVRRSWAADDANIQAKADGKPKLTLTSLMVTLGATWLLGAGLWWLLKPDLYGMPDSAAALQWLIVALAAVTAPHLVLISASAVFLAGRASGDGH